MVEAHPLTLTLTLTLALTLTQPLTLTLTLTITLTLTRSRLFLSFWVEIFDEHVRRPKTLADETSRGMF